MNFMKSKAGFTLVELIVVIAILGILAGIAVPAYSGYIKKANGAKDTQFLSAVYTAAASACAAKGDVSEVTVSATDGNVDSVVAKYKDVADGTDKTLNLYVKGDGDGKEDDADFMMYVGSAITDASVELVKDGTYKSGAIWYATAPSGKVAGWNAKTA